MKKTFCLFNIVIVSLFVSSAAHALLGEVRLNYGSTGGEPSEYNNAYYNFQDGPQIKQQTYTGLDAILMLPMMPLGFGLRYENAGKSETLFNEQIDYAITRVALIVNYRIIDTGFYVGPIVTYGLSQSLSFKLPLAPDEFKAGNQSSYSYGVEGGLKLGLFRLGLETGIMSLTFNDLKDLGGAIPNKNGLNISQLNFGGSYYKLHIGLGF